MLLSEAFRGLKNQGCAVFYWMLLAADELQKERRPLGPVVLAYKCSVVFKSNVRCNPDLKCSILRNGSHS